MVPTTKTISCSELIEIVYDRNERPDIRLVPVKEGGVFKYFHLYDFLGTSNDDWMFSIVMLGEMIVGIAGLQKSPFEKNKDLYWISFVSVDPSYQEKGFASLIIEEIFRVAKTNGYSLETSSFSKVGYERLNKKMNLMAIESGVEFTNPGNVLY